MLSSDFPFSGPVTDNSNLQESLHPKLTLRDTHLQLQNSHLIFMFSEFLQASPVKVLGESLVFIS